MTPVEMLEVSLANLDQLANGEVGLAVKRELEKLVSDLIAYGDDGLPRKLDITLSMKKRTKASQVELSVSVHARLPEVAVRKTQTVYEATAREPQLFFNPQSASNPGQLTFADLEDGHGD